MTDMMLRGALSALKTKIEALASSETATAEDLAMLGTALERIAGKTTAIEVEMLGEDWYLFGDWGIEPPADAATPVKGGDKKP